MMVMTAKVNLKKILVILAAAVILIIALAAMLGRDSGSAAPTAAGAVVSNDDRVRFLSGFGWDAAASPVESGQVRIPAEMTQVYQRYNALQKSQGYDLTDYGGKTVMRYVYQIKNYPNATDPVYATLLIFKNQVIGGDITDTAPGGTIRGFEKIKAKAPTASSPAA